MTQATKQIPKQVAQQVRQPVARKMATAPAALPKKLNNEKMNDSVRAVGRALDILKAFTVTDYELSASELLKRVDLSRPTLYRLMYTLEQSGFLISVGEPQKFRLGPAVAHLAHVWTSGLNMAETARPMLRNLWEETGETAALFISQGAYRTCIAEIPSAQPLSYKRGVGYRERIVLGASGHVIVAHADTSVEELEVYAEGTGIDLKKYAKDLAAIRQRGYAISVEELIQGAVSIAAPFFDGSNKVAGSIVVFGPKARLDADRIAVVGGFLMQEAAALSKMLGKEE
jgi:IclR family acetate operon transcriptional repressor